MIEKQILETGRLLIRRYCEEDLQDLYAYLSDEEVVKYEPYKAMDIEEMSKELDERIASCEMIAVVLKTTDTVIGNVYFCKDDQGNPIRKDTYVYSMMRK